MKRNLGGLTLESTRGDTPTAVCIAKDAILEGFQVNAGALFNVRGGQWHFVTFVDFDTAGTLDACVFYPYEFRAILTKAWHCPSFGGPM